MNFEEKICPFCKKDNNCKVLKPSSCWCMKIKIPDELKDLVPEEKKIKSCICKICVEEYLKNPISFKNKYSFDKF